MHPPSTVIINKHWGLVLYGDHYLPPPNPHIPSRPSLGCLTIFEYIETWHAGRSAAQTIWLSPAASEWSWGGGGKKWHLKQRTTNWGGRAWTVGCQDSWVLKGIRTIQDMQKGVSVERYSWVSGLLSSEYQGIRTGCRRLCIRWQAF